MYVAQVGIVKLDIRVQKWNILEKLGYSKWTYWCNSE